MRGSSFKDATRTEKLVASVLTLSISLYIVFNSAALFYGYRVFALPSAICFWVATASVLSWSTLAFFKLRALSKPRM